MDIAPPLTSTDTRAKQTVAMAIADSQQRKQQQDVRARHEVGSGRIRDDSNKSGRPPRFREHLPQDARDMRPTKRYSSQRQRNLDADSPVRAGGGPPQALNPAQMAPHQSQMTSGVAPAQSVPPYYQQPVQQSEFV